MKRIKLLTCLMIAAFTLSLSSCVVESGHPHHHWHHHHDDAVIIVK